MHYKNLTLADIQPILETLLRADLEWTRASHSGPIFESGFRADLRTFLRLHALVAPEMLNDYAERYADCQYTANAIQSLLQGAIDLLYGEGHDHHIYQTLKEIRNLFVPNDDMHIKSEARALAQERIRQLPRYAGFAKTMILPDGSSLYDALEERLATEEHCVSFLNAQDPEVADALERIVMVFELAVMRLNRAYDMLRDEMQQGELSPRAFSKIFAFAEEREMMRDTLARHAEHADNSIKS